MIELRSNSAAETRAIAAAIAGVARVGDLIVLAGEMGAGKTAFAQGFAAALGVQEPVTSPTFTIVHTYPATTRSRRGRRATPFAGDGTNTNTVTLHHADLYRLDHTTEVADLAFDELLDGDGIVLVEWGDVVDLGPHLRVDLGPTEDEFERDLVLTTDDPRWQSRWDRLTDAVEEWVPR